MRIKKNGVTINLTESDIKILSKSYFRGIKKLCVIGEIKKEEKEE